MEYHGKNREEIIEDKNDEDLSVREEDQNKKSEKISENDEMKEDEENSLSDVEVNNVVLGVREGEQKQTSAPDILHCNICNTDVKKINWNNHKNQFGTQTHSEMCYKCNLLCVTKHGMVIHQRKYHEAGKSVRTCKCTKIIDFSLFHYWDRIWYWENEVLKIGF